MLTNHPRTIPSRWLSVVSLGALVLITATATLVRAEAPACHYSIVDSTVTDNDTKLTWQQPVDAATYTWDQATTYCTGLSLVGDGWRLPTAQELQTIVDESSSKPAIDKDAFPNTPSAAFWSSSPYAGGAGLAWLVDFGDGRADTAAVGDMSRVRCVR